MVVENSAYFPEGSNGLEYYEDVVRAVVTLEGQNNTSSGQFGGTTSLEIPAAWDGDDLSLVLVHEVTFPEEAEAGDSEESEEGSDDATILGIVIWISVGLFFCLFLPLAGIGFLLFYSRNEDKHVVNPYSEPVQ